MGRYTVSGSGADCKSAVSRLGWFDSIPAHQMLFQRVVEFLAGYQFRKTLFPQFRPRVLKGILWNGSGSRVSDLCLEKSRRVHPPDRVRKLVISIRYREITVKLLLRERYLRNAIWPRRLVVRTSALHADNTGPNPVGVTIDTETNQVLRFDQVGTGSDAGLSSADKQLCA